MQLSSIVLMVVSAVVVSANAWEWQFLDDDPTDGLNIGLLQVRNIAADPWGSVCSTGFGENEALAACTAVGMPITSTGYVGYFDLNAADFSEYYPLVTVSCPTDTTPLSSCTVTESTASPSCPYVMLIDCSETADTAAPTESPIIFDMNFSPTTLMNMTAFRTGLSNGIIAYLSSKEVTGIDTSRILIQHLNIYSNGNLNRFEARWQFNVGVPPHQELEEIIILNVWDVFSAAMNLTSFNDILPPSPVPTVNTTGWNVRIYPSLYPWIGMLQVMTADVGATWGTVCNDNFESTEPLSEFNLLASCHSAGFTDVAPGLLTNNSLDDPVREAMDILLDEVNCTAEDYYLTECSFLYSPSGQFPNHDCSHTEDVYINCFMNTNAPTTEGNTTLGPEHDTPIIGWFAEVMTYGYTSNGNVTEFMENFGYALADFVFSPQTRVQFIDVTITGDTAFVSFRFTNATKSHEPPRSLLDSDLTNANAFTLKYTLNITFMWNNATSTSSGSGNQDGNFFVSLSNGNEGLVIVRPTTGGSTSPVSGTVCSINKFTKYEAHSFCLASGLAFDIAGAIPFHGGGTGPVYISDMDCHAQNILDFTNCSYTLTMPGDVVPEPDCTHDADAGAVCAFLTEAIPTADINQDVLTYSGSLDIGMDLQAFYNKFDILMNLHEDRLRVTEWTEGTADTGAFVSFYFSDNDEHDVGRLTYEYIFSHISQTQRVLGFTITKQTQGKPADVIDRHPFGWRDTTGWQFRLLDDQGVASTRGLLEVLPAGFNDWGTGCTGGFAMSSAISICNTLGFSTENAYAYVENSPWAQGRPVYVDNIDCSEPDMAYLQNCTFDYYPAGEGVCENVHIYLDCSGNAPTADRPAEFTAVVEQSRYPNTTVFQKEWATYFNLTLDRVDVSPPTSFGGYLYYSFRFLNNNQTNVDPSYIPSGISSYSSFSVPSSVSGDSYSYASFSESGFSFSDLEAKKKVQGKTLAEADRNMLPQAHDDAGVVPLPKLDATTEEEVLLPMPVLIAPKDNAVPEIAHNFGGMEADAATTNLGSDFDFSSMSSVSLPSGWSQYIPMPNSSEAWPMTNDAAAQINTIVGILHVSTLYDRFGIFEMWSNITKPNGPVIEDRLTWTVRLVVADSVNTGKVGRVELQPGGAAMWGTVCTDASTPTAAAVDYCKQAVNSTITTAAVIPHFTEGANVIYVSSLKPDLTFTMSSQKEKHNDCTHMMDMGVLCDVGSAASTNIYYLVDVVLSNFNAVTFQANLALATGVPVDRITLFDQVASASDDAMYVNFTFTESSTGLSRGDCELMMQYTNAWSQYKVANIRKIVTTLAPTSAPTTATTTAATTVPGPTTTTTSGPTTTTTTGPTTTSGPTTTTTTGPTTTSGPTTTTTTGPTTTSGPTTATTTGPTTTPGPTTTTSTGPTTTSGPTTTTTTGPTTTSGPTTTTTGPTTTPGPTTTTATPLTYVKFDLDSETEPSNLQEQLNVYNGTVITPCVTHADDTKTCRASFNDANNANSALEKAQASDMSGITGAAADNGGEPTAAASPSDDDGSNNVGAIVGGIIAAVVVIGGIAAFVVYRSRRSVSHNDDDDYSGMNMALEDMSPEAMDDI